MDHLRGDVQQHEYEAECPHPGRNVLRDVEGVMALPLKRMVAAVELAAPPSQRTGRRPLAIFLRPETRAETLRIAKTPHFTRQINGCTTAFVPCELGGWRCRARTYDPLIKSQKCPVL